jgi:predicted dehydrogenase
MCFFADKAPTQTIARLSYVNAEAAHRDTHAHLTLAFAGGTRTFGSISKNVHGEGNRLEIHLLGSQGAAHWDFRCPDQIKISRGGHSTLMSRTDTEFGSKQSPFHGLGWLEGYVEILHQSIRGLVGLPATPVPQLSESIGVMETLLKAVIEPW